MCGITGFIDRNWSAKDLQEMTDRLAHRGPDSKGYFLDESDKIGLGHRRLSILDTSSAGNQPFFSKDGRYVMVYNGEVYNFREIAEKYNIHTRTSSDTEVILEAFAIAGIKCVNEFNGMFAIAIWDKVEKNLYLVRDRTGIKPLYYYHFENKFAFASELKSLFTLPGLQKKINRDSIYNFLHLGYIPGNQTIYSFSEKLLPGHYLVVNTNGKEQKPYWQLEEKLTKEIVTNELIAKEKLTQLIESSVAYCMISDVPLGVFLSGGIDSSLVTAVAQKQSTRPVKTFSIAFKDEKFNEAKYARQVANYLHSDHHEFVVTEKEAVEQTERLLDIYDEPYADSSAIPTMLLSRLTRKEVTVALSGDGGDELFMGYGFYYWGRRLNNPFIKAFRKPIAKILRATQQDRFRRASTLFEYPSLQKLKSHIFSQEQYYFTESEIKALMNVPGNINIDESISFSGRTLSLIEEQSFFDIKNYLPEELLVKTDRASMCYSLEVRVPLLDHRIVEYAINLDSNLKLKGNTGKYILKEVLYEYLPQEFFERKKQGFSVPLKQWLKSDLFYLQDKYLNKNVIEEYGIVRYNAVKELKEKFMGGEDYLFTRIWSLIILHKWLKEKHCD